LKIPGVDAFFVILGWTALLRLITKHLKFST